MLCFFTVKRPFPIFHTSFRNVVLEIKFAFVSVFSEQISVSLTEHIQKTTENNA